MTYVPTYISDEPYEKQFDDAARTWREVKRSGAGIDVWTDGQVLNMIRSKMIRLKKFIKAKRGADDISDESFIIPEKMDFEYMAKKKRSRR